MRGKPQELVPSRPMGRTGTPTAPGSKSGVEEGEPAGNDGCDPSLVGARERIRGAVRDEAVDEQSRGDEGLNRSADSAGALRDDA
jgi:hypothetical protein